MSNSIETIKKVHKINRKKDCIFNNVICECKPNGNLQTEKNHIISKSYMKSISNKNRVMVFNYEQKDYYRNGGSLVERNINNANVYNVFCSKHDTLLFNEIENGKSFDISNNKQYFQFAFRSFIFYYSDALLKTNFKLVPYFFEKVAEAYNIVETGLLERFKKDYQTENWTDIESKVIILKRKIEFISCFYARPTWGIDKKLVIAGQQISFNIFPKGEETIVLMSYFKGCSTAIVKYCNRLCTYAENGNEEKLIQYLTKIIIAYDPNVVLNPLLWNILDPSEKISFYKFAHLLKQNNKSLVGIAKKIIKLNFISCKCNLFLQLK